MVYHRPLDYEALSERALALLAAGMSLKQVALELGVGKSSVPRLRDWGLGCLDPRKRGSGRHHVTALSNHAAHYMTESRRIRNSQRRASELFIKDLRREHPEREI